MPLDTKKGRVETTLRRAVRVGLFTVLVLAAAGCATLDGVRQIPPGQGVRAVYHASSEEVADVLPGVLEEAGMEVAVRRDSTHGGLATIGEKGFNLLTYGFYARALVRAREDGSELLVVTQPRLRTELFSPAGRASHELVAAVDEALGPRRIAPHAGMRVRGRGADGTAVDGILRADARSSFLLTNPDDTDMRPRPLERLEELSVHRGSYGRGMEGGIIGSIVGIFVGFLIDGGCDALVCPPIPDEVVWGSVVGGLSGAAVGSAIRTDVWSPMAPPAGRR